MIFPQLHLSLERWKFNKEYQIYVSTLGHFKVPKDKKMRIVISQQNGYMKVLTPVDKMVSAHRLVLMTWRPRSDARELTVDHINHNKRDNSLANLEWVTIEENQRRAAADAIATKTLNEDNSIRDTDVIYANDVPIRFDAFCSMFYQSKKNETQMKSKQAFNDYVRRHIRKKGSVFGIAIKEVINSGC